MFKLFFVFCIFIIILKFINAKEELYAGGLTYTQYQAANNSPVNTDSSNSPSSGDGGDGMLGLSALFGRRRYSNYNYYNYYPSSSSYYNYYRAPQPIYGNAAYTTGQINNLGNFRGQQNLNYNEYSHYYWECINYYRGQYYYSYNFNGYVCDTRANRNG